MIDALSPFIAIVGMTILMVLLLIPFGNFIIYILECSWGDRSRNIVTTPEYWERVNTEAFERACRKYGQDPEEVRKKAREGK